MTVDSLIRCTVLLAATTTAGSSPRADERVVIRLVDSGADRRAASVPTSPVGPEQLPERLSGEWTVSLCVKTSHAWIRFENDESGEVHTLGSYKKGAGGVRDPRSFRWLHPPVTTSGVQWDIDLRHEEEVANGNYRLLNVRVKDPVIFRGHKNGFGHGGYRNNCTTYARDAWHFYSRQWYELPFVETPKSLYEAVCEEYALE